GIQHYDGKTWKLVAGGLALRGVWGSGPGDAWAVGAGTIVHWNGKAWPYIAWPHSGDSNSVLYGVWGSAASDVWAVGGVADVTPRGLLVHFDGSAWSSVSGVSLPAVLYGVWGRSAADV